jgi:putative transcriptional regulator
MRLGAVLREFREERGLSQAALADRLGFSDDYVRLIEAGRFVPNLSFLQKLAWVMGISTLSLVARVWPEENQRAA